jgi:CDP-diacylglycerol--glycerol-3-phosphate 3-phosphatidyltransferase
MNLPIKITLSRILLVPIFMIFIMPFPEVVFQIGFLEFMRPQLISMNNFILKYGNYIATAIFIIAAGTDGIDGYIARKRQQITRFGKFLDPIADKLLVTAALIALVQRGDINGWVALVIIGRELIVTGLRLVAAGEGIVISASGLGKLKTITQIIAIIFTLLKNFPLSLFTSFKFNQYAMLAAVIITIYSGYDYLSKNIKAINYDD